MRALRANLSSADIWMLIRHEAASFCDCELYSFVIFTVKYKYIMIGMLR